MCPHTIDWLLLADDLTGALDSGVHFAGAGLRTIVPLGNAPDYPCAQVLVIDTESRSLSPAGAAAACREAASKHPAAAVFKKIDSTLRGHPAVELAAAMSVLGIERALVAPAFPAQGRVTRGGRVWVSGKPLVSRVGSSDLDGDLVHLFGTCAPVTLLGIGLVRGDINALAEAIRGDGVYIGDAESEGDLERLVQAARLSGIRLFCGASGLAHACAGPPRPNRGLDWPRPRLAVVGSRHPVAQNQVDHARQRGAEVLAAVGLADAACSGEGFELLVSEAADGLRRGQAVVIDAGGKVEPAIDESLMAERLGRLAGEVLHRAPAGGLFLSGGDTAMAVCHALRVAELELVGEALPGLPASRFTGGLYPGLTVITKAGGFGGETTLADLLDLP